MNASAFAKFLICNWFGLFLLLVTINVAISTNNQCPVGPPPQWRQHLDVSSKSFLAPVIVSGRLERTEVLSVGHQAAGNPTSPSATSINGINNNGVTLEMHFRIVQAYKNSVHKSQSPTLNQNELLKLYYRVSASLSTAKVLMAIANNNNNYGHQRNQAFHLDNFSPILNLHQTKTQTTSQQQQHQQQISSYRSINAQICALDLEEKEFSRRYKDIFRKNNTYILFLSPSNNNNNLHPPNQQTTSHLLSNNNNNQMLRWHAYATHEPLTKRSLSKVLCKKCGKYLELVCLFVFLFEIC